MVAEAGVMGTESAPCVESKKAGKGSTESERFRAKRAAMQARKHAQLNKLSTDYALEKQTLSENELEGNDSTESEEVKKRRRKFRKAPELCENMTVRELAAVRSDVDDAIAFSSGISAKPFHCMDIVGDYELDCEANDYEVRRWDRHRKSRLSPKVRHLPDLSFTTKQKLGDATKMIGKKTFIKCDVMSRAKRTEEEMSYARQRKAANVSKLLDHLGLKRRHDLDGFRRPEDCVNAETTTMIQKPGSKDARSKKREREDKRKELRNARKDWRKDRWSKERKEERSRVPHEYELHVGNVECDNPEETDLLCFLLDLQNRDVTPEDYEMLLRLGEKIAPKTVADDKLESLRTVTVPSLSGDGASDISWTDALCAVCMEVYEAEQVVKFLACEHFFHSQCIEMWLNNSGNTCPLDGLEV